MIDGGKIVVCISASSTARSACALPRKPTPRRGKDAPDRQKQEAPPPPRPRGGHNQSQPPGPVPPPDRGALPPLIADGRGQGAHGRPAAPRGPNGRAHG